MKELLITIIIFYSLTTLLKSQINYLDPQPNSKYVNTNNSLIIGFSDVIEANSINNGFSIAVTGSNSGLHSGMIKLTGDRKKILYKINIPFTFDEKINVIISSGLRTINGNAIAGSSYSFYTQTRKIISDPLKSIADEIGIANIF